MSRRAFVFRAQAALDLRQRQYDETRQRLAQVERDLRAAERARDLATARAVEARAQCAAAMREPSAGTESAWYRSWILRRDRERMSAARTVQTRQQDFARAAAACVEARQRLDALVRLRDKARDAWAARIAAEEQKHFDALATMRYVADRGDTRDTASH